MVTIREYPLIWRSNRLFGGKCTTDQTCYLGKILEYIYIKIVYDNINKEKYIKHCRNMLRGAAVFIFGKFGILKILIIIILVFTIDLVIKMTQQPRLHVQVKLPAFYRVEGISGGNLKGSQVRSVNFLYLNFSLGRDKTCAVGTKDYAAF